MSRPRCSGLVLGMVLGMMLSLMAISIARGATMFVDADRPHGGTGLSWATAFADLQDALDAARSDPTVTQVWVAEGTYLPDRGSRDRAASFVLVNSVLLCGGFAGDETAIEQRDPAAHPTVLSGDLQQDDQPEFGNYADNSLHVVTGLDLKSSVVDGFVIRGGNAALDGELLLGGGGMLLTSSSLSVDTSSVTVRNCTFRACSAGQTFSEIGNFGGALLLRGISGVINGCRFEDNRGNDGGALGLFNRNSNQVDIDMQVLVSDCDFVHNHVVTQMGGALYSVLGHAVTGNAVGTLTVQRCRFDNNSAGYWGAWVDFNTTFLTVVDCTFTGNTSDVTGGAFGHVQTGGADQDPAHINGCTFRDNWSAGAGGGVWLGAADAVVKNCSFQGNQTEAGGAGLLASTYFTFGGARSLTAVNCVFDGNVASDGAAIWSADNPILRLVNCTITRNSAISGACGGVTTGALLADVDNTIFWGNSGTSGGGQVAQIRSSGGGSMSLEWSLVQGLVAGSGGVGDIDADPRFANSLGPDGVAGTGDEDLRLVAGSPCIDAGNNLAISGWATVDRGGMPRVVDDPLTLDTGQGTAPLVDMGAFEYQAGVTAVEPEAWMAEGPAGIAVPNPAHGAIQIRFRSHADVTGPVTIYDLTGARVRTLPAPQRLASGAAGAMWDGRNARGGVVPAGVYLARVSTRTGPTTIRIVITH